MPIDSDLIHTYDQSHLKLEEPALHLISLFFADKALKQAFHRNHLSNIEEFADTRKQSKIIRLTVELATAYRLIYWNAFRKPPRTKVGSLWETASDGRPIDLTMTEACNKVIHAEAFAFRTRRLPKSNQAHLLPEIHLEGRRQKHEWRAVINIPDFADAAVHPVDVGLNPMYATE